MSRYAPSMIAPLSVDGPRPLVALVAALPTSYRLAPAETLVLMALACDAYDDSPAPGVPNLVAWTKLSRSTVESVLTRLTLPTEHRPALLARAATTRGRNRTVWELLLSPVSVGGSPAAESAQQDAPTPRRSGGWDSEPPANPPATTLIPGGHPSPRPNTHNTSPPRWRAATRTPHRYLAWLLWQLEQEGAMPAELDGLLDGGVQQLNSEQLDYSLRIAKASLYWLGGNPERLGEAFPEMDAGIAGSEWPPGIESTAVLT